MLFDTHLYVYDDTMFDNIFVVVERDIDWVYKSVYIFVNLYCVPFISKWLFSTNYFTILTWRFVSRKRVENQNVNEAIIFQKKKILLAAVRLSVHGRLPISLSFLISNIIDGSRFAVINSKMSHSHFNEKQPNEENNKQMSKETPPKKEEEEYSVSQQHIPYKVLQCVAYMCTWSFKRIIIIYHIDVQAIYKTAWGRTQQSIRWLLTFFLLFFSFDTFQRIILNNILNEHKHMRNVWEYWRRVNKILIYKIVCVWFHWRDGRRARVWNVFFFWRKCEWKAVDVAETIHCAVVTLYREHCVDWKQFWLNCDIRCDFQCPLKIILKQIKCEKRIELYGAWS